MLPLAILNSGSSARTSAIHKGKFNVPLSGNEHKDLLNFVRHLENFTAGLAEIAQSNCLGVNPEVTIAIRYKTLFKNTRKFKISIDRANLHLSFISFCRN